MVEVTWWRVFAHVTTARVRIGTRKLLRAAGACVPCLLGVSAAMVIDVLSVLVVSNLLTSFGEANDPYTALPPHFVMTKYWCPDGRLSRASTRAQRYSSSTYFGANLWIRVICGPGTF